MPETGTPARPAGTGAGVSRTRVVAFAVVVVLAALGAVGYVVRRAGDRAQAEQAAARTETARGTLDPAAVRRVPHLVLRNTAPGPSYGHVILVPLSDPAGPRAVAEVVCDRVYAVPSGGMCLSADRGVITTYRASVLDAGLRPVRQVKIVGGPSRTRLSPGGRLAASTVFVSGHSYLDSGFSTVTQVVETATGRGTGNLEEFRIVLDGRPYRNRDVNLWGVTFADDIRTFYATLSTGGSTYLVRGDLDRREMVTLRRNAECPALSPDGRKLVYKKATGSFTARRWRFTVLDLATGVETPLPETRNVDDQAAWLDDRQVMYGVPRDGGRIDVWVSPIAGGTPRMLVPDAESPAAVPGVAPAASPTPAG
jgi:hypothetical protein